MRTEHTEKGALVRGLGLFSLGLGFAGLYMPRRITRLAGVHDGHGVVRALALRELVSGTGILARARPRGFLASRFLGDLMDIALLRRAMTERRSMRRRQIGSLVALGAIALVDLLAAVLPRRRLRAAARDAFSLTKVVTVARTPEEVHDAWRDPGRMPPFLAAHIENIEILDDRRGELLMWRSRPGARIPHTGSVRFTPAPGYRGTEVRVDIHYLPTGSGLRAALAKLAGMDAGQRVVRDLRNLKRMLETGELTGAGFDPEERRT